MLLLCSNKADAQVTANFTSDSTSGCGLLELNLINLSTGATSYLWQIYDDGGALVSSSTLTNPTFFLTIAGGYTVTLTATGPGGSDVLTIVDFAHVYTNPTAALVVSPTEGCAPLTVTMTDTSIPGSFGALGTRFWVITGAGALPDDPSISYTFTDAGTYTIYLFEQDPIGCTDYATVNVTVYDSPTADFTSGPSVSCSYPFSVSFTNLCVGAAPLSYLWTFGDGGTSTSANPTHNYTLPGSYDVSLTVTDANGCSDNISMTGYVQINTSVEVSFVPDDNVICVGDGVTFDNLSGGAVATWLWNFGDGTTSAAYEPTHVYLAPGLYDVSLSADFGGGCVGDTIFNNLINVIAAPTVTFTSTDPSSVCTSPWSVTFTPTIVGAYTSIVWTFQDPGGLTSFSSLLNPTHSWDEPGSYDVSVTVTNAAGCTYTYTLPGYVSIGTLEVTPVAFPFNGCLPLSVNFSAIAGEPLVSYEWDLGDGTTSTLPNPTHIYTGVGCYDITLIATSIGGCTDTTIFYQYVCVGDTGVAQFILPDTSCPGVPIEVGYLPLDSIVVIFDGGLDYANASPVDSITSIGMPSGEHELDVIGWNYGCSDTLHTSIYILPVVDSTMLVVYNCDNPLEAQVFIDTAFSNISCGWIWDFGDGATDSVSMNPIHAYDSAGVYHVTVTYLCITPDPCTGTGVDVTIQVPFSNFTVDPSFGCDTPLVANFTSLSSDGVGGLLSYYWFFGDGSTDTVQNPTHTYTDFDMYIPKLTITDSRGCTDLYKDTIYVSQVSPYFITDSEGGCVPYTVVLSDSTTGALGEITTWILDWDDGEIDTFYNAADVAALSHTYTYQHHFDVTLTAINEFGCEGSYTHELIASLPTADFIVDDTLPCVGQAVHFTELATGFSLDYVWSFGDGGTSFLDNPSHTYASYGLFTVGLTVTDVNGCVASAVKPNYIQTDSVEGTFDANILVANCNYSLVQFNSSTPDSICSYFWNFGDGGTSTDPNPIYPYLAAGSYTVTLTMTNCNGCSASITKTGYIIVPGPYGYITVSDDTVCVDEEMFIYLNVASADTVFLYLDNGDVVSYDVIFSDSLVTIAIPYSYDAAGTYFPTALCIDTAGCANILTGLDSIKVGNNPTALFSVTDATQCVGNEWVFTDNSTSLDSIVSWTWDIGDSSFIADSPISFTHIYTDTITYNTNLIVQTNFGCSDTVFHSISALPYPVPNATGDSTVCPGQSTQLSATGGVFYTWTPAAGLDNPNSANPIATPDVTTMYHVEVSNGYCSSFDSVLITVVDQLILYAGPDTSVCLGNEVQLYAVLVSGVDAENITFEWTPTDYLDDPTSLNPVSSSIEDITYTIVANCGNLFDTANAMLQIVPPPNVEIPEDTILILKGQSTVINTTLTGGAPPVTYHWEPVTEVNCPTCPSVTVSPTESLIYSVLVTDNNGCTDIDFVYLKVLTCDESLFQIPNILTPNGDGNNDVFKIKYEGIQKVHSVRVFDRWGEKMFESEDLSQSWDGTFKGQTCPSAVYVYTLEVECIDGSVAVISGNVTLIK